MRDEAALPVNATPALSSAVALARDLVRCPSVTPAEGGALALLEARLEAAGFAVHRPVFSEPGTPDVENLYARFGDPEAGPVLCFAGHTDVVPVGDEAAWSRSPFGGEIADGMLWGRGACDMKGGLAGLIDAAIRFSQAHPALAGAIAVLVTGDEEGPAVNGTVKLLEWARARGERIDTCVLGEPTSVERFGDTLKIGRRGSLTGTLTVQGVQGHVAYPERARNPIPGLVRLLAALGAEPLDAGTEMFAPSNLEIVTVDVGNAASNVIPATGRARFNVRFNDVWTPETLAREIERRLREAAGNEVAFDLGFEPTNAVAFVTRPGPFVARVAAAVEAETGLAPTLSTSGGTSDARFIQAHAEVVELGIVARAMHGVDEHAAVADIEALSRAAYRLLEEMFAVPRGSVALPA